MLLSIKVALSNSFKLSTFEKCNDVIWFASVVLWSTSRDWLLFISMTLPHIKHLVHALDIQQVKFLDMHALLCTCV